MSVNRSDLLTWLGELALLAGAAYFIWWIAGDYIARIGMILEYSPR